MGEYDEYWKVLLISLNSFSVMLYSCIILSIKNVFRVFKKNILYVVLSIVLLLSIAYFLRLFLVANINDHGDALCDMTRDLSWETEQAMYNSLVIFDNVVKKLWLITPYMGIGLMIQALLAKWVGRIVHRIFVIISLLLLLIINLLPAIFSIYWNIPFLGTVIIADFLLVCLILLNLLTEKITKCLSSPTTTSDQ